MVYYVKPIVRNRVTKLEFTHFSERGLAPKRLTGQTGQTGNIYFFVRTSKLFYTFLFVFFKQARKYKKLKFIKVDFDIAKNKTCSC